MNKRYGLLAAAFVLALSACSAGDGPPATGESKTVASVRVTAPADSVMAGQQMQLSATALDEAGAALAGRAMEWASSSVDVATVSASGLVSGVAPGSVTITASSGGQHGQVLLRVRQAPVATVTLTPDSVDLYPGAQVRLALVARDAQGNVLAGRAGSIGSSNAGVATVGADGVVTAAAPGRAVITAQVEGATAMAVVQVRQVPIASLTLTPDSTELHPGGTVQLTLVARDAQGNVLAGRAGSIGTSNGGVATVGADRKVTAVGPGRAIITAEVEGKTATAVVWVTPVPIATLTMTPDSASIPVGAMVHPSIVARDSAGTVLARVVNLTTSNRTVADVGPGVVIGMAPGTAVITASAEGKSASMKVVVTSVPVATVEVAPAQVVMFAGVTTSVSAIARDAQGNQLTGRAVAWTTANASVAAVGDGGVLAGIGAGTTTIAATVEGKQGQATVIVRTPGQDVARPELTGFAVQPDSVDVSNGPGTFRFTFHARDYGSGITSAFVSLNFPNNPGATAPCSGTLVSGSIYDGTWTCTVTFPQNSPSRTWDIDYVSLQDVVGNYTQIGSLSLKAAGWPYQVKVSGATPDTQAPTLTGFSFTPSTVSVARGPGSVVFTISGRDAGTGISSVFVSLNFPNNPGATAPCLATAPVSGTRGDGTFQCTVTFPQGSPTRTWNVDYISLTDNVGNTYRPFQGELQSLGYATTVNVVN